MPSCPTGRLDEVRDEKGATVAPEVLIVKEAGSPNRPEEVKP